MSDSNQINYTTFNTDSTYCYMDSEDTIDAIDYIKNPQNFRPFNIGLKELLYKHGYNSTDSVESMTEYLYNKLTTIGSSISRSSVESWLSGSHRPKIESGYRKNIYEICFSLNLSFDDTVWFFNHVYYDRAFNCHTIDESVFYFAFKNGLTYNESLNIIKQINECPEHTNTELIQSNYTLFIHNRLDEISTIQELIAFLSSNKSNFNTWNISAFNKLTSLFQTLIPTSAGKKDIDNIIRTIKRKNSTDGLIKNPSSKKEWHLIMQEFFSSFNECEDIIENLKNVNICSNNFVINWILYKRTKADAATIKSENNTLKSLPYIVKNNFPSKKTMSDLFSEEKISVSKSYDAIRKMIILLYFYRFWCQNELVKNNSVNDFNLSDVFIDEINTLLYDCGYEYLYAGNPYDWIFLTASQSESPLTYFRDCMSDLLLDE